MKRKNKTGYWITSAENDWKVAGHLLEKGDFSYSLFFGHLTLEKLLKAYFVAVKDENRVGGTPIKGFRPLTEPCVRVRTRLLMLFLFVFRMKTSAGVFPRT